MSINPIKRPAESLPLPPAKCKTRIALSEVTTNICVQTAQSENETEKSLLKEGIKLCREKNFPEGITLLNKVINLYAQVISPSSKELCYRELGNAHFELAEKLSNGNKDEIAASLADFGLAIDYLTKASKIGENPDARLLQNIHYKYGIALGTQKDLFSESLEQFEKSLDYLDILDCKSPKTRAQKADQQSLLEKRARSTYNVGRALFGLKEYQKGLIQTDKALSLFLQLDKPHQFRFICKQNLAFAQLEICLLNIESNSATETIDQINKAFSTFNADDLLSYQNNDDFTEFLDAKDLSECLERKANNLVTMFVLLSRMHKGMAEAYLKDKKFHQALEQLEKVIHYNDLSLKNLIDKTTEEYHKVQIINTTYQIGRVYFNDLEMYEDGIKKVNDAVKALLEFNPLDSELPTFKKNLATAHHLFAKKLIINDEIEKAIDHFTKAINFYQEINDNSLAICWEDLGMAVKRRYLKLKTAIAPAA